MHPRRRSGMRRRPLGRLSRRSLGNPRSAVPQGDRRGCEDAPPRRPSRDDQRETQQEPETRDRTGRQRAVRAGHPGHPTTHAYWDDEQQEEEENDDEHDSDTSHRLRPYHEAVKAKVVVGSRRARTVGVGSIGDERGSYRACTRPCALPLLACFHDTREDSDGTLLPELPDPELAPAPPTQRGPRAGISWWALEDLNL